jgi:hypothetical protein
VNKLSDRVKLICEHDRIWRSQSLWERERVSLSELCRQLLPVFPLFSIPESNRHHGFYELPASDQLVLVGEMGLIDMDLYTIVEVDEESSWGLCPEGCRCAPLSFFGIEYNNNRDWAVYLHGCDDTNLRACFKAEGLTLESLASSVLAWLEERNYRKISTHELAEHCVQLGAWDIDWN